MLRKRRLPAVGYYEIWTVDYGPVCSLWTICESPEGNAEGKQTPSDRIPFERQSVLLLLAYLSSTDRALLHLTIGAEHVTDLLLGSFSSIQCASAELPKCRVCFALLRALSIRTP